MDSEINVIIVLMKNGTTYEYMTTDTPSAQALVERFTTNDVEEIFVNVYDSDDPDEGLLPCLN